MQVTHYLCLQFFLENWSPSISSLRNRENKRACLANGHMVRTGQLAQSILVPRWNALRDWDEWASDLQVWKNSVLSSTPPLTQNNHEKERGPSPLYPGQELLPWHEVTFSPTNLLSVFIAHVPLECTGQGCSWLVSTLISRASILFGWCLFWTQSKVICLQESCSL